MISFYFIAFLFKFIPIIHFLIPSDQYTSPKIIKLMELEEEKKAIEDSKITAKKKLRLDEIEKEIIPLKQFLEDAKAQRLAIRNEIGMLH